MKKLFDKILPRRRRIIVEEGDIVNVIKVINQNRPLLYTSDLSVGNCGWNDEKTKWFIFFTVTNSQWKNIRQELNVKKIAYRKL
jgi:hypothetical protein